MGIFEKRGNWFIDLRIDGRRRRKKVGPSKEIALLALKDIEVKRAKAEWLGILDEKKTKFRDFAREWLKEKKIHLKPSTLRDFNSIFDNYLFPHFGEMYLSRIKEAHIERFLGSLGHLSTKRINTSWFR